MSIQADQLYIRNGLQLQPRQVTAGDLDANNVLTLRLDSGSDVSLGGVVLVLDAGLTIAGVRVLDKDQAIPASQLGGMVLFIVGLGGEATIANAAPAVPESQRFAVQPATTSVSVGFVFSMYSATLQRWVVPNRLYYAPAAPVDWDPTPDTWTAALDQLAARAPLVLPETSVTFTSGNPVTVWTYTLAEGEAIGVSFTLLGGTNTAGTIDRSFGSVSFTASRSVGGSAALTVLTAATEVGTVSGGTLDVSAVGNDVVVTITYTTNGTLYYRTRVGVDRVAPL